jgi:hypothetical protein
LARRIVADHEEVFFNFLQHYERCMMTSLFVMGVVQMICGVRGALHEDRNLNNNKLTGGFPVFLSSITGLSNL